MSGVTVWRSDSTQLVPGGWLSSAYPGFGIQAQNIPATGDSGPSFLYKDIALLGAAPTDEFMAQILTLPTAGIFTPYEDGTFTFTGAPDGLYSFTYRGFRNGVAYGDFVVVLAVGASSRALLFQTGQLKQITDAELSTGKKPLVLLDGQIKERAASEGIPIVYDAGGLRTLASNETLLI